MLKLKFTPLPSPLSLPTAQPSLTTLHRPVTSPSSSPCRRCLRDGIPGQTMLLLQYNPFPPTSPASPYTVPGPIYVHADTNECTPFQCDGRVPEQQRRRLLAVRAFDADNMMVGFAVVQGTELGEKAAEMLGGEGVGFLLVFYAGPGCFAVRADRG